MAVVNWGIIGCGDVTEIKSGPAFNKIAGSRLAAVMRRDAGKAADYAQRHGVAKWYANADELMDDPEINAIYVATPPSSHLAYAAAALKRGLHVYVEKPVVLNAGQALELANLVKQGQAKLSVAHYRRRVPMFLHVKKLLDDQAIGEIRTVQIRMWQSMKPALVADVETNWRVNPELSGGGYFHDLAPHQLDLMLYYFGEPGAYHGFALNQSQSYPTDDHVCGQIRFKNNVVVNGSWCFNVADTEAIDLCEIVGSKGKISFPFFGNFVTCKTAGGDETVTFNHPPHIEQPMIEQVVAFINDEAPNPCTIDEAIVLMNIMDAFTRKE